jgi:hypothetical protein
MRISNIPTAQAPVSAPKMLPLLSSLLFAVPQNKHEDHTSQQRRTNNATYHHQRGLRHGQSSALRLLDLRVRLVLLTPLASIPV